MNNKLRTIFWVNIGLLYVMSLHVVIMGAFIDHPFIVELLHSFSSMAIMAWGGTIALIAYSAGSAVKKLLSQTEYNLKFHGQSAEILIDGLRLHVLRKVELSSSDKAKFNGEVAELKKILAEQIPQELAKVHDIMQTFDSTRDYTSVHKSAASYTNFYHSASVKLQEIIRMEKPSIEDIDNELADIIEAWDKIEQKYM